MQFIFSIEKSKKDTFSIDEVYVTRVRPAERDKSAASLQSISNKELDFITGNTAADAIKNFSGISLKDYGGVGGFKTVMVRSLGASHTGVFVDGVQFSDAASGQVDLGKINIDQAEGVSLYIGQPQEILQPARMFASASVLNVQSSPVSNINKPLILKASIKTGSFGFINPNLDFQNKWSDRFYSNISLSYSHANGVYPFKISNGTHSYISEYRKNSDIQSLNLNSDFIYKLSDSSNLSCKFYYYDSQRGLPGAVVFYNPNSSQQLWNKDFFTNFRFLKKSENKLQWLSNVKISGNYLRYLDPDYLNTAGSIDNKYNQTEYYFSQAVSYPLSKSFKISLASDFIVNQMNANLPTFAKPTRYSSLSALAGQWILKRFEVQSDLLATIVTETTNNGQSAPDKRIVTPTVSFSYLIFREPSIRIRAMYKDIFRMPTFNDLYYTQIGNTNLSPEWAKQYSTGISAYTQLGIFEYISFKTDLFQNSVKDKIVAVPTKNLFIWSMRNIGKVDIKGIETNLSFQTHVIWKIKYNLSLNYSYQKALDISDPSSSTYKQQIPYIPFENFSGILALSIKSISLSWNSLYNGYRYILGENIYDNMLPSWWLHDAALVYKLNSGKTSIKIKAEISNIFNHQYEVVKSFPMPGRSFAFTLLFNY